MSVNYVVKLKQIPFDIMSNANIMSYILYEYMIAVHSLKRLVEKNY